MIKINKKTRIVCISLSALVFLSGCAPKQDDNLAVKTLKHASMTPVYAGAVVEGVLMVAIATPIVLLTGGFNKHKIEIEENKYKGKLLQKHLLLQLIQKSMHMATLGENPLQRVLLKKLLINVH